MHRRTLLAAAPALLLTRRALAADTQTLRVGDQKGGAQALMQAAGVLDNLPYRLEWSQFAAAAPLLEALNAGAVDIAFAGDAPTTFALASGVPAKIIGLVRGTGASTAIVVPANSPIRQPEDLKGKRVGTNRGSIGHALVLATAQKFGWAADDIKIANLLPSDAKAALQTGAIDAWSTWNSYVAQARLVDNDRVVIDGSNGVLSGMSFQVAREDAIAAKRPLLLDYLRRHAQARRWATTHVDAYADALAAEINVTHDVAKLAYTTELANVVPIDDTVIADEQKTADRYTWGKITRTSLTATTAFDRSFNASVLS